MYPNPYKEGNAAVDGITFAGITDDVSILIFTTTGRLVNSMTLTSTGGSYDWDLTNSAGGRIKSGLYVYALRSSTGTAVTPKKGKFIVIR